jgi:glucosamine 6-phosphate synthetase-like amidotransferase/phosphosugar isomerase protein
MCGICGLIAPHSSQEWKLEKLRELLRESQKRGSDATGFVYVDPKTQNLVVEKDGSEARKFTTSEAFLNHEASLPSIVLGHTRAISMSRKDAVSSDNENNHPFFSDTSGLAIVHNGLVDDEMWRDSAGKEGGILFPCKGKTDSEIILRVIETIFLRDTVEESVEGEETVHIARPDMLDVLEDAAFNLAGDYVFGVVARHEPNKVWFVKKNKPLCLAHSAKERAILFASDNDFLEAVLQEIEERFEFFYDWKTPLDVMMTEIDKEVAVEVTINLEGTEDELFEFRSRAIDPPTKVYTYHKKAADMLSRGETLPDTVLI